MRQITTTRLSLRLGLLFLTLMVSCSALAKPTASVDRSRIGMDETFQLTISINTSTVFAGPDLSPLNKDFRVLGRSQSSRHFMRNGKTESSTEWLIRLAPKHTGDLLIPAIKVKNDMTDPIRVQVTETASNKQVQGNQVFVEAQFDQQQAYVQSQLIFTLRLYSAVALVDLNAEPPNVDQAFVEKLSDTTYEKTINGQRYGVYEVKYAVFPQNSGELTVPPMLFSASIPQQRRRGSFFDNFANQGTPVRLRSPEATIDILEQPATFAGQHWLPARDIQLEESWSADPKKLTLGDSITRTIKINAKGLMAEQLPPLQTISIPGVKTYPDQPITENQMTPEGVASTRAESLAILATQPGQFQIPPLRIQWWDTETNTLRETTLPARSLSVSGHQATDNPQSTPLPQYQPTTDPSAITETSTVLSQDQQPPLFWVITTTFFAIAWLVTLFLYWRLWQKVKNATFAASYSGAPSLYNETNEKRAWQAFVKACRQNNPNDTRQTLIQWANCFWPESGFRSLDQFSQQVQSSELSLALQHLEQHLYGATGMQEIWNGELLLTLVKDLRKNSSPATPLKPVLQPLYPM